MNEYADRPFTVASFIQFIKEKKLMGTRCRKSGGLFLPPRAICPECFSDQMEWVELGGKGVLAAFTIIYTGFKDKDTQNYVPYYTGIVELEEGVKISAIILGLDITKPDISYVGMPGHVMFDEQSNFKEGLPCLIFACQPDL